MIWKDSTRLAVALALALTASGVQGQGVPPAGQVLGVVASADDSPLGSVSIELYAHRDSSLAAGALSDGRGRFRIDGLRPGRYRLRAVFVGHAPHTQDLELTPASAAVDVGRIRLSPAAIALDAIEANATRGAVTLEVDRTVVRADQVAATGGNATDVLRNVPGVDVDVDGKVSLRGSSSAAIQINGRAAPVQGDALANFLKQLPASAIDRVEVVPNPSARYDPEGMAGIINLVLKQNTELGLSGGVTAAVGTGGKYNGSGNLGYQAGRLTLTGSLGANDDTRSSSTHIDRANSFDGVRSYYQQRSAGDLHNRGLMLNGNVELQLSPMGALFTALTHNRLRGDLDQRNVLRYLDSQQQLMESHEQLSQLEQSVDITDVALGFRRTVPPTATQLTTEVRFNRTDDQLHNEFGAGPTGPGGGQQVSGVADNLSLQTDLARPFGPLRVELGQKFTARGLDHERQAIRGSAPIEDASSSYDERILAGYGMLTRSIGPVALQAGLRLEHTATELTVQDSVLEDDYLSLFPSASALYSLSETQKLRLSYSRRIQRPNSRFMNPYPVNEDPQNVLRGNPALRPEMTHSVELSWQQSGAYGSVQVQPFLRHTSDPIRVVKSVSADGIATTSFSNLASSTMYGTDANLSARPGGRLNGTLGVSVFQLETEGASEVGELRSESLAWNARASLGWTVTPQVSAQWTVFHRGPMNMEQGRVRALTMTSFSLQRKLFDDRGTLSLRVNDPFDAMRMSFTTADANHVQTSWRKIESRIAHLSFAWQFGKAPRVRQRAPQQEESAQVPIF